MIAHMGFVIFHNFSSLPSGGIHVPHFAKCNFIMLFHSSSFPFFLIMFMTFHHFHRVPSIYHDLSMVNPHQRMPHFSMVCKTGWLCPTNPLAFCKRKPCFVVNHHQQLLISQCGVPLNNCSTFFNGLQTGGGTAPVVNHHQQLPHSSIAGPPKPLLF